MKDMYNNVVTSVHAGDSETGIFPIKISLDPVHFFALVMAEVTKDIKEIFLGVCSLMWMWC
jgi:hypothetical protein